MPMFVATETSIQMSKRNLAGENLSIYHLSSYVYIHLYLYLCIDLSSTDLSIYHLSINHLSIDLSPITLLSLSLSLH